jgi:hypothetical protein
MSSVPALRFAAAAAALVLAAGQALSQQNLILTNPGFELDDPSGHTNPLGWLDFNASSSASTDFVHSGARSLKLIFGSTNFAGSTTNFFDPNTLTYPYDPVITYLGGPITVSGWYLIPANHPIVNGAFTSLKLQVRRVVNNSSYQDFEWPVSGDTAGQWVFFTRTVQNADFGSFPLAPTPGQPTRCSVLPEMFGPNGIDPNAVVYWDDLSLTQGSACYPNCDNSTTPPILNVNDFICFQSAFASGNSYANCDNSTTPPVLNVNDFICFQSAFAAGCP